MDRDLTWALTNTQSTSSNGGTAENSSNIDEQYDNSATELNSAPQPYNGLIPTDDEPPPPYEEIYDNEVVQSSGVSENGSAQRPLNLDTDENARSRQSDQSGCRVPKTFEEWMETLDKTLLRKGGGYTFMAMMILLAIPNVWFGSMYKNDCPAAPSVPIHLITSGWLGMFSLGILLVELYLVRRGYCTKSKSYCVNLVLFLILLGWYVYGNILAGEFYKLFQSEKEQDYVSSHLHYIFSPPSHLCRESVFSLFFWSQITVNVLWLLWIMLVITKYFCRCRSQPSGQSTLQA
ncbi:uncharacterized protein [Ptychodera flava]|uniref:uncharacterized protein n=1 Tax=Ptychodera flava TaxID=63121 RepID=UPI003969E80E